MATQAQRDHMGELASAFKAVGAQIPYEQERPITDDTYFHPGGEQSLFNALKAGLKYPMDCSAFVISVCYFAGLADPSGFGYNGQGNTTSIWTKLGSKAYKDGRRALKGAFAMWGDGSGTTVHMGYVAVPDTVNGNPLIAMQILPGPDLLTLDEYNAGDPSQVFMGFLPISSL